MKTLPVFVFLAAFGAFLFSSLSFETSASLLFATGFLAIVAADYARPRLQPVSLELALATSGAATAQRSHLRLAV